MTEYIEKIKKKLEKIDDQELSNLINRLINERNYLENVANIDPLTGLYNRRILERIRECSGILMCDIDNFKTINDTYGHDTGDYAIKSVANILLRNTRINDYVCRLGGDEFFIVFNDCEEEIILERCKKINNEVSSEIKLPDHIVTLSLGIAYNKNNESVKTLLTKADEALYISKNSGKNQASIYKKR